jgi:D-alanine-D-alanine ligase-like ATP-grasp enzyme
MHPNVDIGTGTTPKIALRTLAGPSVFVPFAAVVAQFTIPAAIAGSPNSALPEVISGRLPATAIAQIKALNWSAPFETLVARLAKVLQDWYGLSNLPYRADRTASGLGRVYLAYYDEQAASCALKLGYGLVLNAFAQGPGSIVRPAVVTQLAELCMVIESLQPDETDKAMIPAATARTIPFYRVAPVGRIFQYGQGKYGRHFFSTGSQFDSSTGVLLQHEKVVSNSLVRRLGFPGVEHGVADSANSAVRLARQIGYPAVIKPINGRQGQGVTAGVTSDEEVATAFAKANAISPRRVIVEGFVYGENVRLAVYCGRFAYATLRSPPRVVGDGKRTVTELVALENQRRAQTAAESHLKQLHVDADMIETLQTQNLGEDDCVPAGQVVTLRRFANLSAGGTAVIVTDRAHPENQSMAETIARCFRLDTAGIDFLTPDLTKSWHEVKCAVIEVNSAPSFSFPDLQAKLMLQRAFPGKCAGRIPSLLVVDQDPERAKEFVTVLQRQQLSVGFVKSALGSLGTTPRAIGPVSLGERVQRLLLDPAYEALVMACTPDEILEQGLPLDRFDLCVIESEEKLPPRLFGLLNEFSGRVVENVPIEIALKEWLEHFRGKTDL